MGQNLEVGFLIIKYLHLIENVVQFVVGVVEVSEFVSQPCSASPPLGAGSTKAPYAR